MGDAATSWAKFILMRRHSITPISSPCGRRARKLTWPFTRIRASPVRRFAHSPPGSSDELKASQQNRRFAKNIVTVRFPVPPWLAFSGVDFNALKRLWTFNQSLLSTRLLVSRSPEIRLQFVF
jgi:hypothetical protein